MRSMAMRISVADPIETEALEFAGHLLVPTEWLKHAVKKYRSINITVRELAKIFDVSEDVIVYRLRQENIELSGKWPKL